MTRAVPARPALFLARAAVHAEMLKLLTLPALWLTAALTLAVVALLGEPVHAQAGLLVFGALAVTHEYQGGGQIRAAVLAVPRRPALLAAKLTAVTVTAAPLAALAALLADRPDITGDLMVTAALAATAGMLIRHPAGTIAILLSCHLLAGPILRARLPATDGWLPDTVGAWQPALAWTAALLVPAAVTFARRDA